MLACTEAGFQHLSGQFGTMLGRKGHVNAILDAAQGGPKINWAHGVYTPTYDKVPPHRLLKLRHWQGAVVDVGPTHAFSNVTKAWDFQDNWSDFAAYFEQQPALPVHCRKFVGDPKDRTGPYSLPLVQGAGQNSKVLNDWLENKFDGWMAQPEKLKEPSQASQAVVTRLSTSRDELAAVLKVKAKAKASHTTANAKETMEARKKSRRALKRNNSTASVTSMK